RSMERARREPADHCLSPTDPKLREMGCHVPRGRHPRRAYRREQPGPEREAGAVRPAGVSDALLLLPADDRMGQPPMLRTSPATANAIPGALPADGRQN